MGPVVMKRLTLSADHRAALTIDSARNPSATACIPRMRMPDQVSGTAIAGTNTNMPNNVTASCCHACRLMISMTLSLQRGDRVRNGESVSCERRHSKPRYRSMLARRGEREGLGASSDARSSQVCAAGVRSDWLVSCQAGRPGQRSRGRGCDEGRRVEHGRASACCRRGRFESVDLQRGLVNGLLRRGIWLFVMVSGDLLIPHQFVV